jgi:hypothetical protein
VRKVTSQAVQKIEGSLKATNTTARYPFTSQRKNVSGGNLRCKKYHKTWSLSLLLQYKAFVSIFCQSSDNGRIASNREKQFYTNNMALLTNGL